MSKFKVGDRVHLREDSVWFCFGSNNPYSTSVHGTITHVNPVDGFEYRVKWDSIEAGNVYEEHDLSLVETKEEHPVSEASEYKPFGELSRKEQLVLFNAWLDGREIEMQFPTDKSWAVLNYPQWWHDHVYRIAHTKPSIEWGHVAPEYKWIASDENGETYLYKDEPKPEGSKWYNDTYDHVGAEGFASFKPGTCDWKDSLVKRPEGV